MVTDPDIRTPEGRAELLAERERAMSGPLTITAPKHPTHAGAQFELRVGEQRVAAVPVGRGATTASALANAYNLLPALVALIDQQAAELTRLGRINPHLQAENKRLSEAGAEHWRDLCAARAKLATLESEREMNAVLTEEVERLRAAVERWKRWERGGVPPEDVSLLDTIRAER